MGEISISVKMRHAAGKSANRKLRAEGRVPAIVYAKGKDPVSVSLNPVQLERKIKASHAGINTLFDLEGDSEIDGRTVMVKELQRDPIRGAMVHADFHEIDLTQRIQVAVPICLVGEAPGVSMGGVIEHTLRELALSCLPGAIPDGVSADVSSLELDQSPHVSDLQLPEGVELMVDESRSVVSVVVPRVIEEAEPEEGEVAEGEAAVEGEGAAEGEDSASSESSDSDKGSSD